MEEIKIATSMTCDSCVAKVKPELEAAGIFKSLEFDMKSPRKVVRFVGNEKQKLQAVSILNGLGYKADPLKEGIETHQQQTRSLLETYQPLILVGVFLIGITALVEYSIGAVEWSRAMRTFMGGFFIFFSFFKFLNLSSFADAFSTYDVVAMRSRLYGFAYPFIELVLGVAFVLNVYPNGVNLLTIILMAIGNIGVWNALKQKRSIQCACLGTVFNLPMTKVTIFENTLMLLMAVIAIAM